MFTLNCKGRLWVINQPVVMGILNATPDSFYSSSRVSTTDAALQKAEQLLREGAAILDIGAQSTRPGSQQLGADEEMRRLLPVIEAIVQRFPESFISVDTYHASVAWAAVDSGASVINDISGGTFDEHMLTTIGQLNVPYICMHLEGTAATMHQARTGGDFIAGLLDFFTRRIAACREAGIKDIILDPGFGFSKSLEQNFQLVRELDVFHIFQLPLLLGVSRKSTIYQTIEATPETALNGTTVLHTAGLLNGADILRVHDVKEAVEAIRLTAYLRS